MNAFLLDLQHCLYTIQNCIFTIMLPCYPPPSPPHPLELPDPPVVSVIPSLDGETLVVNCSHAVTGGTPDSYVIKVTSTTTKTVAAINGDVIATFSQLTQNTTYSIRVTAANCAGHSGETEVNATTGTLCHQ